MVNYDDVGYSRSEKIIAKLGKCAKAMRPLFCAFVFVSSIAFMIYFYSLYTAGAMTPPPEVAIAAERRRALDARRYNLTNTPDPEVVAALQRRAAEEAAVLARQRAYDRSRYRWLGTKEDIADSVVLARERMNRTDLLLLVASGTKDPIASAPVRCSDLVSSKVVYEELLRDIYLFLPANIYNGPQCSCAPMFGKQLRYMVVGSKRKALLNADDFDAAAAADGQMVEPADTMVYEHMLNPIDKYASQYESLDADFFAVSGVDFTIEQESEDYRYNLARGSFSILRRTKVIIEFYDRACHKRTVTVEGALSLCIQHCLDLMQGIDVAQRAALQAKRGVKLNQEKDTEINVAVDHSPTPATVISVATAAHVESVDTGIGPKSEL